MAQPFFTRLLMAELAILTELSHFQIELNFGQFG